VLGKKTRSVSQEGSKEILEPQNNRSIHRGDGLNPASADPIESTLFHRTETTASIRETPWEPG